MDNFPEREKMTIESLLENESLTAGLNEHVAKIVLDWGIEMTLAILRRTKDLEEQAAEETTYSQQKAVRRLMRDMSRLLVALPYLNTDDMMPLLNKLVGYGEKIFGPNYIPPTPEERVDLATKLTSLRDEPLQAAARLRQTLAGAKSLPEGGVDEDSRTFGWEVENDY